MGRKAWSRSFALRHTFHEKNKTSPDLQENQESLGDPTTVGHKKRESAVRYLGIEADDAFEIPESIEV